VEPGRPIDDFRVIAPRPRLDGLLPGWAPDCRRNGTVQLIDSGIAKLKASFAAHRNWTAALAFSPDGTRLLTGGADEMVKLWDLASLQELITLRGHRQGVLAVTFSRSGELAASAGTDGMLRLWRTR
jgi:WD40 repeat protein